MEYNKKNKFVSFKFYEILLNDLKNYTDFIEVDGDKQEIRVFIVNQEDK